MPIRVFTKSDCYGCRATKRTLDKLGLDYTEIDVATSEDARREVEALGYRQMPVVVAGDKHWCGYSPDKLTALAETE